MELINEATNRFAEEKDYKLMVRHSQIHSSSPTPHQIVDSIMALFRTDYSGRGELSERQQKLAQVRMKNSSYVSYSFYRQMLSKLSKVAEEYNVSYV